MASRESSVTLGLLYSRTGVTSLIESAQRQAAMLAVHEINAAGGLLGNDVLVEDSEPASTPKRYGEEAERLLQGGVDALFGCYMSSSRKEVLPVIEARQSLLFYPTLYEGFEYVEACVYSGAAPNQNARYLADYLCDTYEKRFFFVGSNYVFPYESNRIMRDLLDNRGATVVDEVYIPLSPTPQEIDRVIARIRAAGPACVFATIVGQGAVDFYRAYHMAGFDRSVRPIASLTFGEPEVAALGLEASVGNIKAAPYFSTVKSASNTRFVKAYREFCGSDTPVSAEVEAAYFQVHLFAEGVRRCGSTQREKLLKVLPTFTLEAPQGPVRVDAKTHHTYLWPRVAIVGDSGDFEIVRDSRVPVAPRPYLVEHDDPVSVARQRTGDK